MEGFDQEVGQIIDKSHGIGKHSSAAVDLKSPGGGREGGERLILGIDHRAGEGVEQGALASIGVSGQGDEVKAQFSASLSPSFAHCLHLFKLPPDLCHPPPDIVVHRLLISTCTAESWLLTPLLKGKLASHLRSIIAQTGQLHLQLGLPGGCPGGKDLEDQIEPVQYLGRKLATNVEYLGGAERIVEDELFWMAGEGLLYLSPADLKTVVPLSALLYLLQDSIAGGICQAPELYHPVGIYWIGRILPHEKNCGLVIIHQLSSLLINYHSSLIIHHPVQR